MKNTVGNMIQWVAVLAVIAVSLFSAVRGAVARQQCADKKDDAILQLMQKYNDAKTAEQKKEIESELVKAIRNHDGPVVEGGNATIFLIKEGNRDGSKAEIFGDFNGWFGRKPMQRLGLTSIYYYRIENIPDDSRIEYKLKVDGREMCDPMNPLKIDNGEGSENSIVQMPGYRPCVPSGCGSQPDPLKGKTFTHQLRSSIMNNSRKVTVYTPPGYDAKGAEIYPLLLVHDGTGYLERAKLAVIAERLIEAGRIKKMVIVFVDPVERNREYGRGSDYTEFTVKELVPWISSSFRISKEPSDRAVLGASMGGLISFHLAFTHPEVFGRAASQSGAFGYDGFKADRSMFEEAGSSPRKPISVYLDAGLYDLVDRFGSLLENNREMERILKEKGYPLCYREYDGGHNWTCWRDQLQNILCFLFGTGASGRDGRVRTHGGFLLPLESSCLPVLQIDPVKVPF
jgi:enterochelin esterase family protein